MTMSDPFNPRHGEAVEIEPGLRRIVAQNPSPMTHHGTNTYLLGTRDLSVIDPGPLLDEHLGFILSAVRPGQRIARILVTHGHLDHSPLASQLARATGAPVCAFGPATAGRSDRMRGLAENGLVGGGEGLDRSFVPDVVLSDGEALDGGHGAIEIIHTPGHLGNHLCFAWNGACFTGDHVMGWASSLVSPPDGDLTDFMASCRKLAGRPWRRFFPGHGPEIEAPAARLDWLISHRLQREAQILSALRDGAATPKALTARIYTDVPDRLRGAAERNVLAHLVDLHGRSMVHCTDKVSAQARFALALPRMG